MKKAVIYARFSSSSQTEQSIEGQLRVCNEYAKKNNIAILNEYIDRARTGTNDARPSFQLMMSDASKKDWDCILVYKLDRFSRNKYDSAIYKRKLKELDIKLISVTENIPDSPEAIIFESVLEGFAQYYSAELSQKVKRGLKESYIKGRFTGGAQLFGYDVVDHKNIINSFEASIVKEVFEKYSSGYTCNQIAESLKQKGITSKTNKLFTAKQLYKMLINTKYNGKATHNGVVYSNIYPKIIDDELWNKVANLHEINKKIRGSNYIVYEYLLTGKLFCGNCKCPMTGTNSTSHTGAKHSYYSCRSKGNSHAACKNKSVRKKWLEDIITKILYNVLSNSHLIKEIASKVCEINKNKTEENFLIKTLEQNLKQAKEESKNINNFIKKTGTITKQLTNDVCELEKRIANLEYAIAQERAKDNSDITEEEIIEFFKSACIKDFDNDYNLRKLLVKTYIKSIIMYNDKILINFNIAKPKRPLTNKDILENIDVVEKIAGDKNPAFLINMGAFESLHLPPREPQKHPRKIEGFASGVFLLLK